MSNLPSARSRPATWADLLAVPEGYIGEIVAGELIMTPRPAPPHIEAASDLGTLLGASFRFGMGGPGGWIILHEPRIAFVEDIRVPDLAGWRKERYVAPEKGPYTVMPDWIAEVLSPSTVRTDRGEKLDLYLAHGVRHVWLIDPVAHTLEVYRAQGSAPERAWLRVKTFTRPEKVRAEPFDAIELDLALLWGPTEEPPADE